MPSLVILPSAFTRNLPVDVVALEELPLVTTLEELALVVTELDELDLTTEEDELDALVVTELEVPQALTTP